MLTVKGLPVEPARSSRLSNERSHRHRAWRRGHGIEQRTYRHNEPLRRGSAPSVARPFRLCRPASEYAIAGALLRPLDDGDIADQQAEYALAVTRCGGWSGPEFRESAGQLQDLPFLFGRMVRSVRRSKLANSASSSSSRCIASFQRFSSVLAIRRLAGSTAS